MLYVKREGNFHSIRELEVSTKLKLNNIKDYITGKSCTHHHWELAAVEVPHHDPGTLPYGTNNKLVT